MTAAIRLPSQLFEIRVDSSSNFALHEAIEHCMSAANAAGRPSAPTCDPLPFQVQLGESRMTPDRGYRFT